MFLFCFFLLVAYCTESRLFVFTTNSEYPHSFIKENNVLRYTSLAVDYKQTEACLPTALFIESNRLSKYHVFETFAQVFYLSDISLSEIVDIRVQISGQEHQVKVVYVRKRNKELFPIEQDFTAFLKSKIGSRVLKNAFSFSMQFKDYERDLQKKIKENENFGHQIYLDMNSILMKYHFENIYSVISVVESPDDAQYLFLHIWKEINHKIDTIIVDPIIDALFKEILTRFYIHFAKEKVPRETVQRVYEALESLRKQKSEILPRVFCFGEDKIAKRIFKSLLNKIS